MPMRPFFHQPNPTQMAVKAYLYTVKLLQFVHHCANFANVVSHKRVAENICATFIRL